MNSWPCNVRKGFPQPDRSLGDLVTFTIHHGLWIETLVYPISKLGDWIEWFTVFPKTYHLFNHGQQKNQAPIILQVQNAAENALRLPRLRKEDWESAGRWRRWALSTGRPTWRDSVPQKPNKNFSCAGKNVGTWIFQRWDFWCFLIVWRVYGVLGWWKTVIIFVRVCGGFWLPQFLRDLLRSIGFRTGLRRIGNHQDEPHWPNSPFMVSWLGVFHWLHCLHYRFFRFYLLAILVESKYKQVMLKFCCRTLLRNSSKGQKKKIIQ